MDIEKGKLTVNAENIFPIIKKALYSEREIFLRELISNAVDAIKKLHILNSSGVVSLNNISPRIDIRVDRFKKCLSIEDNGIGMTKEEVKKYIGEIAFSGAKEFLEKYADKHGETLIGCFGLGFYSAFLVAEEVRLDTKSYHPAEQSCQWRCSGDINFELYPSHRKEQGTQITLLIDNLSQDMLDAEKITHMVKKYSDFVPYPIYLNGNNSPLNSIDAPLYLDKNNLSSSDYLSFYHKLYPDHNDCLFWIHINIDHPLTIKGIFYFPSSPAKDGDIRLYSKRVFIQDQCGSVAPGHLQFLQGVVDIEDIPLNVSRDRFQTDPAIAKIKNYIQKKVAERIQEMARSRRGDYNEFWLRYQFIIKKGALLDDKWFKDLCPFLLFSSSRKDFTTIDEYLTRGVHIYPQTIYYLTDRAKHDSYIEIFKNKDIEVLFLDDGLGLDFLLLRKFNDLKENALELKRIDTIPDVHIEMTGPEESRTGTDAFREYFKEITRIEVEISRLYSEELPAVFKVSGDYAERDNLQALFKKMDISSDVFGINQDSSTLVLNLNNPLTQSLYESFLKNGRNALMDSLCEKVYQFAKIRFGLSGHEEICSVITETEKILTKVCKFQL